jgi:hypothetical protein
MVLEDLRRMMPDPEALLVLEVLKDQLQLMQIL